MLPCHHSYSHPRLAAHATATLPSPHHYHTSILFNNSHALAPHELRRAIVGGRLSAMLALRILSSPSPCATNRRLQSASSILARRHRLRALRPITCIAALRAHSSDLECVGFHPKLPFLVTCSRDHTAKVWRMNCNSDHVPATCIATLQHHAGPVLSAAFHPLLPLLSTGSRDATVHLPAPNTCIQHNCFSVLIIWRE